MYFPILSIGEPNPVSPSAGLLSAFAFVLLALRQQGRVVRTQKQPKFLAGGCFAVFLVRQGVKTRKTPQGKAVSHKETLKKL